ncbi:YciI family protein [Pseudonocardia sp. TRM90224]|uniref:YciI family protein n=1 Tax=Pseudonocardia sp. TRM90224 TaxID=2812678 RepID=UPI001E445537|nr:YciI family protein [Pseudonocardia sp. TRM90224]
MTQYLLAVHIVEDAPVWADDEGRLAQYAKVDRVNAELVEAGAWVFGGGLLPSSNAAVVRFDGGAATMTDGPFAETKEQLGGFWVLSCADRAEAMAWAGKCAEACGSPIEVRPFEPDPDSTDPES